MNKTNLTKTSPLSLSQASLDNSEIILTVPLDSRNTVASDFNFPWKSVTGVLHVQQFTFSTLNTTSHITEKVELA